MQLWGGGLTEAKVEKGQPHHDQEEAAGDSSGVFDALSEHK